MLSRINLSNVGPAPAMTMELGPRLNLLTGDNGLGKSFLLDIAWWTLTRKWPAEVNPDLASGLMARPRGPGEATISFVLNGSSGPLEYISRFSREDQAWTGRPGRPANPGLVIYAQADGGAAIWDPARNYWRTRGDADVHERRPAYVFSPRQVWEGLQANDGALLCKGLLADWAAWQRENGEAFEWLEDVLRALSPSGDTLRPGDLQRLGLDDVRDIPTIRAPYGVDVPVVHASAGVRRILGLAYLLVWSWREHDRASALLDRPGVRQVIFLIDEIEAHLHPRWQRKIVRPLLEIVGSLADKAEVQLVVATHSPLVAASLEPIFNPAVDAWHDLDLEPGPTPSTSEVRLRRRPFLRRGDVSSWLTSEAFDLKHARSLEAEQALVDALALLYRGEPASSPEAARIDAELREVLSELDPFWVRWSAFMEAGHP